MSEYVVVETKKCFWSNGCDKSPQQWELAPCAGCVPFTGRRTFAGAVAYTLDQNTRPKRWWRRSTQPNPPPPPTFPNDPPPGS